MRQPTFYISHGGGPCFFMEWTMGPADTWDSLRAWLEGLIGDLAERPSAILIATAHWEADPVRVTAMTAPIETALETERGFDHGVFVPLKVMVPKADIPTVAMSLRGDLDPAFHQRLGAALAPLRDDGILILGSGSSYHNQRGMMTGSGAADSAAFDEWLIDAAAKIGDEREHAYSHWAAAPSATDAHPREEHLIPLMVASGAARDEPGERVFADEIMSVTLSAIQFGSLR